MGLHPPGSLVRVLTGTHRASSGRVSPLAIGFVAAVVVVGLIAIYIATGGKEGPLGSIVGDGEPERTTPAFDFETSKAIAIASDASAKQKDLQAEATRVANETTPLIDSLYTEGFLDPDNWTVGAYDEAWEVFDENSRVEAQTQGDALTAGPAAGDTFTDIQPVRGVLETRVLVGPDGEAVSVVAIVNFIAQGSMEGGSRTLFRSEGQYFLRQVNGEWKVVGFEVDRADKVKAPKPSPSASGSPS